MDLQLIGYGNNFWITPRPNNFTEDKEAIKQAGFRYDGDRRSWFTSDYRKAKAFEEVADVAAKKLFAKKRADSRIMFQYQESVKSRVKRSTRPNTPFWQREE